MLNDACATMPFALSRRSCWPGKSMVYTAFPGRRPVFQYFSAGFLQAAFIFT
jgi:hypothetical protein